MKREQFLISTVETGSAQTYKIDVIYGNYFCKKILLFVSMCVCILVCVNTVSSSKDVCVCFFTERSIFLVVCCYFSLEYQQFINYNYSITFFVLFYLSVTFQNQKKGREKNSLNIIFLFRYISYLCIYFSFCCRSRQYYRFVCFRS